MSLRTEDSVAFMTKTGMYNLLREIMESGGMTEDMEEAIQRIKDDFDEREGILKKYGTVYDGEDKDEYDWEPSVASEYSGSDKWKDEYERMRKRYLDRFFGGVDAKEEFDEIMEETEDDVIRDGEPQTFDELLERREG